MAKSQRTLDNAIDDIAATLGVSRSALGIVAAVKGLVNGGITITTVDGEVVEGTAHGQALILADVQMESVGLQRGVDLVLLVEKAVVVTGKGYPDVATRELLAALSDMGALMFALVDLDPHGIEIMATVPFGN